jgi:hypothetical protein
VRRVGAHEDVEVAVALDEENWGRTAARGRSLCSCSG